MQAVLASPGDDAPRRNFSDWCDKYGDPKRGEFIRQQLQVADCKRARAHIDDWVGPDGNARDLIREHGKAWQTPLDSLIARRVVQHCEHRRGFVEMVTMTADDFIASGAEVCARTPLRALIVDGAKGVIGRFSACEHLNQLVALFLTDNRLDDDDIGQLAASPHLSHLAYLDLTRNKVGQGGIDAIAMASKRLPRLSYVGLTKNAVATPMDEVGAEDFRVVATGKTTAGVQLEAAHGPQRWLHAPSAFAHHWPVDWETVDLLTP